MVPRVARQYRVALQIPVAMLHAQPASPETEVHSLTDCRGAPAYHGGISGRGAFDPCCNAEGSSTKNALVAGDLHIVVDTIQADGLAGLAGCEKRAAHGCAVASVAGTVIGIAFEVILGLQTGCAEIDQRD